MNKKILSANTYNMIGQLIKEVNILFAQGKNIQLDFSEQSQGQVFLIELIFTDGTKETKKIVL
jgi:hypothetical protein